MPALILVRHAQASFGADDYDVLSDRGRDQAAELVPELRRRGVRIERVVTGTLRRQRDTAAPVAADRSLDATVDARWDEYDSDAILSRYSASPARAHRTAGEPGAQVTPRQFQDILEAALLGWIAAGDDAATTESYPRFRARCESALRDAAAGIASGGTALVCTSGGVLAAVCAGLLRAPADTFLAVNRVAVNAGITKVVTGRQGATLISFNDHGHLEGDGRALVTYR